MDGDASYFRLPARSDNTIDLRIDIDEESEEEDDVKIEHICPFCFEAFDLVGFCCHIDDDHPVETKSGICPICARRVGINMPVHVITQHGRILKAIYKKKLQNGELLLCKSLEDEYQEPLDEEPSSMVSSSNVTADPLLSSFIYNPLSNDEPLIPEPSSITKEKLAEKVSEDNILKRNNQLSPLSDKDLEKKAQRCELVQELLYSTIFED
ncbi:hypothetical protein NMG60_11017092 [Bertholletia excelsa]